VYDFNTKQLSLVSEMQIQEPTFSRDGSKLAYGSNNNLYIKDLASGKETQLTFDGKKNHIINGITDWVYEEEFSFVRAFDWNETGDKLAFIRFDESQVPRFSMDIYGDELYPSQEVFKYPKAGDPNSVVSLHLYDVNLGKTQKVDLDKYNNYYIPRLKWTKDKDVLSVQLTNRKQNTVDLVFVEANTLQTRLVLQETDNAYVDINDNLTFLPNNSFIWTSERNGWNHIYLYDRDGKLVDQLTDGEWEVTDYYGFDQKTGRVYFQSSERGSIYRDVYSVSSKGRNKVRLTEKAGSNSADFSSDFGYFINSFSNSDTPYLFTLHKALDGSLLREIKNNNSLKERLSGYVMSPKEFSTVEVNGEELNMYMIKPANFDPQKQYPMLMYQYSGPGSQRVVDRWGGGNDFWHQMLAQQGIIIACVDGRGTGLKGRDFKKVTQRELGKYEVQDQTAAARKLGERSYIDAQRIGIWGWSYGGFMSANCLFQSPDTFSLAIAVAPVTSWRFYDTIYTERYMDTPQANPSGYDDNSPISHVDGLEGDFLLVHGSADDNVHVQNSMRLIEALVRANKQFDWLIYPDKNHGIYGGNTRLHLYTKMTGFIKDKL
jgi:dipeptidyl-peptidase-4